MTTGGRHFFPLIKKVDKSKMFATIRTRRKGLQLLEPEAKGLQPLEPETKCLQFATTGVKGLQH
jgi:hypothetical protein